MRNLTSSFSFKGVSEFTSTHVPYLKQKASCLGDQEKIVNLLLDEIYINPLMDFKRGNIGIADNTDDFVAAGTVQTFMITSVFSKNKNVVALVPVKNLQEEDLYKFTSNILNSIHLCGYTVLSIIIPYNNSYQQNYVQYTSTS